MTDTPTPVDILICGSGPVGSTLAILLASLGQRSTLIGNPPATSRDARGIALTADVRRILTMAGAWQRLDPMLMGHMRYIDVVDARGHTIHFSGPDAGLTALAYVVPYDALIQSLQEQLEETTAVQGLTGTVHALTHSDAQIQVTLDDGHVYASALVVGADGITSRVRTLSGISYEQQRLDTVALTAVLETGDMHRDHAWQRFGPEGPLALLPLGGAHRRSLIWAVPGVLAAQLLALNDREFEAEIGRRAPDFGGLHLCGLRQSFPLGLGQSAAYVGPRVALVGDAAHQMHPLAGQGMNLGLEDAAALAALLSDNRYGSDPGGRARLRQYERWRKAANAPVLLGVEWLRHVFEAPHGPWAALRGLGLRFTEHQPWIKRQLMRQAAGLSGNRPLTGRIRSAQR